MELRLFGSRKDRELTITSCIDPGTWGLPFYVAWWSTICVSGSVNRSLSIKFLCFLVCFDYWDWRNFKEKDQIHKDLGKLFADHNSQSRSSDAE